MLLQAGFVYLNGEFLGLQLECDAYLSNSHPDHDDNANIAPTPREQLRSSPQVLSCLPDLDVQATL
jgi:hypothetical protein